MASNLFYIVTILFSLNFMRSPCEGCSGRSASIRGLRMRTIFLPRSSGRITWPLKEDPAQTSLFWYFIARGSSSRKKLFEKIFNNPPRKFKSNLPGVAMETPATLVLKNVDERYNGVFLLTVNVTGVGVSDYLDNVYIAAKPNVTVCSSPITVSKGNNVTCKCSEQGGSPPGNMTWFDKDDKQIDKTKLRENVLTLINVNKHHSGKYTCIARSYIFTDEKSIEVRVNSKPYNTTLRVPEVEVGQSVDITCESFGFPNPSFKIIHNDSNTVSTDKLYTISKVKWSDAGKYTCYATNKFGRDLHSANLAVVVKPYDTTVTVPEVEVGGSVKITCQSFGVPSPNYIIYHNNSKPVSSNTSYMISTVKWSDSGKYTCIATNRIGNDTDYDTLTVVAKPYGTVITVPEVEIGGLVKITCQSFGVPPPNYTIICNDSNTVSTDKSYMISKVKWSDSGKYTCIASNKIGNDTDYDYLAVVVAYVSSSGKAKRSVIVVIVVPVIGTILFCILLCFCGRWIRKRKLELRLASHANKESELPQMNSEYDYPSFGDGNGQTTKDDKMYEKLDLTKMNTEDNNYQKLTKCPIMPGPQTTEVDKIYQNV